MPTLVEVKRASNPQVRREVVGQLFEYAANAALVWIEGDLRRVVEDGCQAAGREPDEVLSETLGVVEPDDYWSKVDDNLRLGRLRLLVVADRIPKELQRIVEFLNERMDPTEILAVEVRQFSAGSRRTLVPRVLGRTSASVEHKGRRSRSRPWTVEELYERIETDDARTAKQILAWADREGLDIVGGTGAKYLGLYFTLRTQDELVKPVYLYEAYRQPVLHVWLDKIGPRFEEGRPERRELCERINAIVPVDASPEAHYPGISFELLQDAKTLAAVLTELSWALEIARQGLSNEGS